MSQPLEPWVSRLAAPFCTVTSPLLRLSIIIQSPQPVIGRKHPRNACCRTCRFRGRLFLFPLCQIPARMPAADEGLGRNGSLGCNLFQPALRSIWAKGAHGLTRRNECDRRKVAVSFDLKKHLYNYVSIPLVDRSQSRSQSGQETTRSGLITITRMGSPTEAIECLSHRQ